MECGHAIRGLEIHAILLFVPQQVGGSTVAGESPDRESGDAPAPEIDLFKAHHETLCEL
jgi:hypothetical protein